MRLRGAFCRYKGAGGFNPRTRRACDEWDHDDYEGRAVSIHARVERATGYGSLEKYIDEVSIHARVERATSRHCRAASSQTRFNPRTRRACDTVFVLSRPSDERFNPRTRRACDQ